MSIEHSSGLIKGVRGSLCLYRNGYKQRLIFVVPLRVQSSHHSNFKGKTQSKIGPVQLFLEPGKRLSAEANTNKSLSGFILCCCCNKFNKI